ncbi:MAG: hypothetical protein E7265_03045 [Lachnospiraceae bacterium]|nr:hypothetical protein [Lachnospiraceae bacterium]
MGFFKNVDNMGKDDMDETLSVFDEIDVNSDEYKDIEVEMLDAIDDIEGLEDMEGLSELESLDGIEDSDMSEVVADAVVAEESDAMADYVSDDIDDASESAMDSVEDELMQDTYSDAQDVMEEAEEVYAEDVVEVSLIDSGSEDIMDETTVDEPIDPIDEIEEKEVTVITRGTTIKGGISSDCSLEVMGIINGDVECQGKLSIFGTVSGNTEASEIFVNTPIKLVGDLKSTGCVKVSEESIVVGTIKAASAFIAGAVKGDIEVAGPVVVDASAVVLGNISAKSLQLNNGAVVEGVCTVGSVGADVSKIFD